MFKFNISSSKKCLIKKSQQNILNYKSQNKTKKFYNLNPDRLYLNIKHKIKYRNLKNKTKTFIFYLLSARYQEETKKSNTVSIIFKIAMVLAIVVNPYLPRMFFSVDCLRGGFRRTLSLHVQYS